MSKEIERRSGTELRATAGAEPALTGYAASFNILSRDLGGFREIIAPGAFGRSLSAGDDVVCLQQHDPSKVLGRRSAGTLTLAEDARGLKFTCKLDPDNSDHMNLRASVLRGDIHECSFAFTVPDGGDQWDDAVDENGQRFARRTLKNISICDVSAVLFPAYSAPGATQVAARTAGAVSDEAYRASKLAWLAQEQADWKRRERAHEILMDLIG